MNKLKKGIGQVLSMVLAFFIVIFTSIMIARFAVGVGLASVVGVSMEPNLKEGETYMFTERSPIERYDVVLSKLNIDGGEKILVKRVIGIPEDELVVINGDLYINGLFYEEPYVVNESPEFDSESFKVILGPDEYFLMGDNRDFSLDSRDDLGIVNVDSIMGVLKREVTDIKKGVKLNE